MRQTNHTHFTYISLIQIVFINLFENHSLQECTYFLQLVPYFITECKVVLERIVQVNIRQVKGIVFGITVVKFLSSFHAVQT